jgi:uncharacterized protein (UPF0332 family)
MTSRERIIRARESVEDALLFARERMGNKAVLTKFYHAMMECLFALFDIKDIGKLTHADIIERFEQEYVKTGKIDATIFDVLRRTYDLTHECDCEHMPVPTDYEIESAMKAANELINVAEGFLGTEVKEHENSAV